MSHLRILVAGGTGFIGQAFIESRLELGDKITVVGRDKTKIVRCFTNSVTALQWQELNLETIKNTDVIVNLAGANIGDKRWTKKRKKIILNSRVNTTQQIAALCAKLGKQAPRLYNASAIGIYGPQVENEVCTELSPADMPSNVNCFLSVVGQHWEAATQAAKSAGCHVVNLRFAPVLSERGGVLQKLLPFFKLGLGQVIGSGRQYFSWVSLADTIKSMNFLIAHPDVEGPINIVAPESVTQKQFAQILAKSVRRPLFITMPSLAVKLLFGQMGQELLLDSLNVYPHQLTALNYTFAHKNLEQLFTD
jgi:uncharacterized protein (TIGR01777 family)